MNLSEKETLPHEHAFEQCDFCNIKGVVGQNIFFKGGWHFCKLCLLEIEFELKKRSAEKILDS